MVQRELSHGGQTPGAYVTFCASSSFWWQDQRLHQNSCSKGQDKAELGWKGTPACGIQTPQKDWCLSLLMASHGKLWWFDFCIVSSKVLWFCFCFKKTHWLHFRDELGIYCYILITFVPGSILLMCKSWLSSWKICFRLSCLNILLICAENKFRASRTTREYCSIEFRRRPMLIC